MNSKILKFTLAVVVVFSTLYIIGTVSAASIGISVGYSSLTVGGSTVMTISGNDAIGKVNISSSAPNVVSVSQSSLWLEGTAQVTLTTKAVGSATITVSAADMADSAGNAYSGANAVTINVNPVYIDTRSGNNFLSSISLGDDLKFNEEFSRDRTLYSLDVPYNITSLKVNAEVEDSKSKVAINGAENLVVGDNNITVVITAENESTRTIEIKAVRMKNPDDMNSYLKSLKVEGATLRNEFAKKQYYYLLEDIYANVNSIEVKAEPEIKDAKVEIIGDKELKVGLNVIEVKVTSKDESVVHSYKIEVYKKDEVLPLVDVDDNKDSTSEFVKKYGLQIVLGFVVVVELIIIVVLLLKKKNDGNDDEYYERNSSKENENKDYSEKIENVEDTEITEDTLKYNDPDVSNKRRRR